MEVLEYINPTPSAPHEEGQVPLLYFPLKTEHFPIGSSHLRILPSPFVNDKHEPLV